MAIYISKFLLKFSLIIFIFVSCNRSDSNLTQAHEMDYAMLASDDLEIVTGAEQLPLYYPLIKDKKIGLVVNQTSTIDDKHLVDSLLELGVTISAIFAPEHGFRGEADAGEAIASGKDPKTGLPIISIYGKNKKPKPDQLDNIDIMLFDIQDVGARFYTYIYSLHYVMEACAEEQIPVIVLDRPNPNGFYVDGPVLDLNFSSFVGMHETPVVHGMTIGEYSKMINGEKWLKNGVQCELKVIPCLNYDHTMTYDLPIKPSPNLPNLRSILLYPSICFFEGTSLSIGRGTQTQFQVIGHPELNNMNYKFTPISSPGAKFPKHQDTECNGVDLRLYSEDYIKGNAILDLSHLLNMYEAFPDKLKFFLSNNFFDKLAGSDQLRKQIIAELTESEIRDSWEPKLSQFKAKRQKYLIYKDFTTKM